MKSKPHSTVGLTVCITHELAYTEEHFLAAQQTSL